MSESFSFDHIHLISQHPSRTAEWYRDIFGAEIVGEHELRGAPQIAVRLGGATLLIRGQRSGEAPTEPKPIEDFADYSSHNEWGTDHFGFTYRGNLMELADKLRDKGVKFAVEPWEFSPGGLLCYVAAPDGVSIEIVQSRRD